MNCVRFVSAMPPTTSAKLISELQEGKISETFVSNVQTYLAPVLAAKGKTLQTSSNCKQYGLLCMKILRGCVQLLTEGKINTLNVSNLVLIAKDAFHCVQKTKLHHRPVKLALEKLLYHITTQLLKVNYFADALTFAEYLKCELYSVVGEQRDNEYDSICKQTHTQLWKACISLQKSTKQSTGKHKLVLDARQLALSVLLLTNHDRKWIVEAFIRTSSEFEQHVGKDQDRYPTLLSFFTRVLAELLSPEFKSRIKFCSVEEDLDRLLCPVLEVAVQYTKCSILGKGEVKICDPVQFLFDVLQNNKWSPDVSTSLTYLRALVSLLRILLHKNKPAENHASSPYSQKKRNKAQVPNCTLSNSLSKDTQCVKKSMEKEQYRILPMTCLAEGLELFRKSQENLLSQQESFPTSQSICQVLHVLRLNVDILAHLKQYYLSCEEGAKGLNGKSVSQLYQRTISRLLSALNLMSSLHLQKLRQVTNSVDRALVSEASWVVHKTDEVIGSVSEGGGGALSIDEHRWLGNMSYNLGLVLYQKQIYDVAETLILMSNKHLLHWCTQGECLLLDRTEKVNLWNKFELQLDCQRRLGNPEGALVTVATVLDFSVWEKQPGIQRSKWLELWWKVKRDLARKDEYEELRSRTTLDMIKEIDGNILDDSLAPMMNLLEDELKLYEQQKYDTLHEEYAVVCDLLDVYQGDDYLPERAVILIKLSHLLRTGRLETENTPLECIDTAMSLIQDEMDQMDSSVTDRKKQLEDVLAQANFWTYICRFEENLDQKTDEGLQSIGSSWNHLYPLQTALQLWESALSHSTGQILMHPESSTFCLRKLSEIFGLHKLPLLQLRSLTLTVLLSEQTGDDQGAALAYCSMTKVLSILGMLEHAAATLDKTMRLVASTSEDQTYLQCCVIIAEMRLLLHQDEREKFRSKLPTLLKLTNQMCHNYNRYFISAETKLLLARYTATSSHEKDDLGLDVDGDTNLDLCPMQPAQEAMRLFTGVSKGVMGKNHDGSPEFYSSNDASYWLVLQNVLESLHLVSELYTLQGCVREAKYYAQEGLTLCKMYNLPRWVAIFQLNLCEIYNIQRSEDSSLDSIKTVYTLLQVVDDDDAKKKEVASLDVRRTSPSVDESMDESFILHTRRMSASDLSDRMATFSDFSIDSPVFVSHAVDCTCSSCVDLEVHKHWIHLFSVAAELIGVEHDQFVTCLDRGETVWKWCHKKWEKVIRNALIQSSTVASTKQANATSEVLLSPINENFANICRLRVVNNFHLGQLSDVPATLRVGLDNLKFCKLSVSTLSLNSEFQYLEALWHIYMLKAGDTSDSLDELISTCWSDMKGNFENVSDDITHQLGQLTLSEDKRSKDKRSKVNQETTPTQWRDSISGTYSRPELSRKETAVTREGISDDVSLDSLGLFSDIVDSNEGKTVSTRKQRTKKLATAKKKPIRTKTKNENHSDPCEPTSEHVEATVRTDVFDFDEELDETKPKRGRGRPKKQTAVTPAAAKKTSRSKKGKSSEAVVVDTGAEISGEKSSNSAAEVGDIKEKKPTRRRGRPAATEKVRDGSIHFNESFTVPEEEYFCSISGKDRPDFGMNSHLDSSPSAFMDSLQMETVLRPPRVEDGEAVEKVDWSEDESPECEEIEIPRALSSEEEEPVFRRRGCRTTGKKAVEKKRQNRKRNKESSDCTVEKVTGIDAAIKCLEEALALLKKNAPNPMYRKVCQLLALCLGEKQPRRAAEYLSQSISVTLRHQKLTSLSKKLRKLKHLEEAKNTASLTGPSDDHKQQKLLSSSEMFSFSSALNSVDELASALPSGWTVCQLSIIDVRPTSSECLTDTSFLFLSRLERGQSPLVAHLPMVDAGTAKKSADTLMTEFEQIFRESKETVKNKDKQVWWASRQSLNDQLKELMESFEKVFFGCWKVLLLSQVTEESLQGEVQEVAKRFSELCAPFTKKEINEKLCESIVNGCSQVNRPELLQALAFLLGLTIGCSDLAQALVIFQDLTKDILKKLTTAKRHPTVLILDKQLHHIPWESIPVLRAAPVFRIPSLHFLLSSLQARSDPKMVLGSGVNVADASFVLNPSKDLVNTQKVFQDWFEKENNWEGVTGRIPSKEEYTAALTNQDLFIYCGHGNGREYFSGDEIQRLTCRAATLLIGCSSGKLTVSGSLDAAGMALSYIVAECPCIVANLWDVTDRDIDRFLEHLLKDWLDSDGSQTLLDFVADARNSCRLQYLIGSAPVMYGIPVRLAD